MSVSGLQWRRNCTAPWLGVAVIVVTFVFPEAHGDEKPKADARPAAELVDAITNRNKPPKLVDWPPGSPWTAALFPEDFDWKEEFRARRAISELENDQTEAVFDELLKRTGDWRYSEMVTDVDTGNAHIRHVASICGRMAHWRLHCVYQQHLPGDELGRRRRIGLNVDFGKLSELRKHWPDKSLYELQIIACEKAIEALATLDAKRISQTRKEQARTKIEAEIATLKKNKQAVYLPDHYTFEVRGLYKPEIAKKIREAMKSGKHPPLDELGLAPK